MSLEPVHIMCEQNVTPAKLYIQTLVKRVPIVLEAQQQETSKYSITLIYLFFAMLLHIIFIQVSVWSVHSKTYK